MRRHAIQALLATLTVALVPLVGCGPTADETGDAGPTVYTYSVRGIIQSLPDPETGAGRLRIRHEAIPDLVGQSGEVEGMAAMTMPFPVAEETDLASLAVGDVVRFELRVDWQAGRPVVVTSIEKLPAETELTLD